MGAYYNEIDPFAAAWLRELIAAGLLPGGDVDERSIVDVRPADLAGYRQCHFFAGIGGWAYGLGLAGWPDDEEAWTGSCPCQPFSVAGAGKGTADEHHLWPEFRRLIAECRPERVFGEQVDGEDGLLWLAGVHVDLEAEAYRVGAAVLPAASVGAPHQRHRIYWVADTRRLRGQGRAEPGEAESGWALGDVAGRGERGGMADADDDGPRRAGRVAAEPGSDGRLHRGSAGGVAHPERERGCSGATWRKDATNAWEPSETIPCGDGKWRRVAPGVPLLAHGVSGRVGLLRGFGNAIVPQVAAEFVMAYREVAR